MLSILTIDITTYWQNHFITKRNTFEAVARLCLKITYGNFDEEAGGYQEESEISALEKYVAKFGPSFPVKAYSKVLCAIIWTILPKVIRRTKFS